MKMELEDATRVSNRVIEMEDVRRGEHIAIIGDNGTGKSTFIENYFRSRFN